MGMRWGRAALALVAVVVVGDLAWLAAALRPRWEERQALQRRGFVCRKHTDGSEYVVFVPHVRAVAPSGDRPQQTQERLPLIVFLNGTGENGDDGVKQLSNNFGSAVWELKGRFPFAVLATQCGPNGHWTPDSGDTQRLLEVLDRTIAEYDIDPGRICLTGPSAGGTGVWQLGAAFADRFAAIVPLASGSCGMPEEDAIRALADANMPVWSFCNAGDTPALVEFHRRMHAQLVAAGLESRLTEYDADGHDCWTDAYRTPALYEWLWRQQRSANVRGTSFRSLPDEGPLSVSMSTEAARVEMRHEEARIESGDMKSAGVGVSPASIFAAWRERSVASPRLRMEWRREAARGVDRFARAGAEWVPVGGGGDDLTAAELALDGDRLLCSQWRMAVRPHGHDPEQVHGVTARVAAAYPERMGTPYLRTLLGHFADETAEQRPVQRFWRSYDGRMLQDYWEGVGTAYPRATLHAASARGSTEWATLQIETETEEQLQTLELMAALVGVRPDHPLLGIDVRGLSIFPEAAVVGGASCVVVQEISESVPDVSQRLYLDREREWAVRRYVGTVGGEGVQIDLEYSREVSGRPTPVGWTVLRFAAADRPVQVYARSEVIKLGAGVALDESRLKFAHPVGTWVVDRRSGESYLVDTDGERRIVREEELRWLPTYEELLQTRSGEARVFIEGQIAHAERWRTVRWPLAAGGALLAIAVVVKWRSGRQLRNNVAMAARADAATNELSESESALRS